MWHFSGAFQTITQFKQIEGQVFPDFTMGPSREVAWMKTGRVESSSLLPVRCGQAITGSVWRGSSKRPSTGWVTTDRRRSSWRKGCSKPLFSDTSSPPRWMCRMCRRSFWSQATAWDLSGRRGREPSHQFHCPAIATPYYDAVGVRIYDLPLTAKRF